MCISTTQKFYNINRVFFLKHKFNITVDLLLKNVIMYTNTRAILWQVIQMNNYSSVKHFSLNRSNYITEIKKLIYCIFCNYVKMSISRRLSFPSCIFFILLYLPSFPLDAFIMFRCRNYPSTCAIFQRESFYSMTHRRFELCSVLEPQTQTERVSSGLH